VPTLHSKDAGFSPEAIGNDAWDIPALLEFKSLKLTVMRHGGTHPAGPPRQKKAARNALPFLKTESLLKITFFS